VPADLGVGLSLALLVAATRRRDLGTELLDISSQPLLLRLQQRALRLLRPLPREHTGVRPCLLLHNVNGSGRCCWRCVGSSRVRRCHRCAVQVVEVDAIGGGGAALCVAVGHALANRK